MATTRGNKGGMEYALQRRNRRAEAARLKDFDQMRSREVLGKLYRRHSTGFWQTIAFIAIIVAVLEQL